MGIVRETFIVRKKSSDSLWGIFSKTEGRLSIFSLFPYRIIRIYSGLLPDGLNRPDSVHTFPSTRGDPEGLPYERGFVRFPTCRITPFPIRGAVE